jgi:hypothetical protein
VASKLSQLFDIRNVIGTLLAIYGVVLTIAGFAPGLLREREKGAANPDRRRGRVLRLGLAASGACRGAPYRGSGGAPYDVRLAIAASSSSS